MGEEEEEEEDPQTAESVFATCSSNCHPLLPVSLIHIAPESALLDEAPMPQALHGSHVGTTAPQE